MKTLCFECKMGAAGDMLVAAMLELVTDTAAFVKKLQTVCPPSVKIFVKKSSRGGVAGTIFDVVVNGEAEEHGHHSCGHESAHHHHHHHTSLKEIRENVMGLGLPQKVTSKILSVYDILAEAESKAHGCEMENIHFHEVGSLDAIVDIMSFVLLIEELKPDKILVGNVNVGGGVVKCAHGLLPVPAPATSNILSSSCIVWHGDEESAGELLTPTGAALLANNATPVKTMPVMRDCVVGYGLGHKEIPNRGNFVRAFFGDSDGNNANSSIVELKANIDDMTGEELAYALEQIRSSGAVDLSVAPIFMKKGRPGHLLIALSRPEDADKVAVSILKETSTIGVRRCNLERYELYREENPGDGEKKSWGYGVERVKRDFAVRAKEAQEGNKSILETR